MKYYFYVSFQYSETTFCTNIAYAPNSNKVSSHYGCYNWVSIRKATDYEIKTAKIKGMPVVNID